MRINLTVKKRKFQDEWFVRERDNYGIWRTIAIFNAKKSAVKFMCRKRIHDSSSKFLPIAVETIGGMSKC